MGDGFAMVPDWAVQRLAEEGVTTGSTLLALVAVARQNALERPWTAKKLDAYVGLSPGAARKGRAKLIELGIIEKNDGWRLANPAHEPLQVERSTAPGRALQVERRSRWSAPDRAPLQAERSKQSGQPLQVERSTAPDRAQNRSRWSGTPYMERVERERGRETRAPAHEAEPARAKSHAPEPDPFEHLADDPATISHTTSAFDREEQRTKAELRERIMADPQKALISLWCEWWDSDERFTHPHNVRAYRAELEKLATWIVTTKQPETRDDRDAWFRAAFDTCLSIDRLVADGWTPRKVTYVLRDGDVQATLGRIKTPASTPTRPAGETHDHPFTVTDPGSTKYRRPQSAHPPVAPVFDPERIDADEWDRELAEFLAEEERRVASERA